MKLSQRLEGKVAVVTGYEATAVRLVEEKLVPDGKTDIFSAKQVLDGHMCLLGDVPPGLLTLGTPDAVRAYCARLLKEIGSSGYIMAMGCAIPPDSRLENARAMVDSVK